MTLIVRPAKIRMLLVYQSVNVETTLYLDVDLGKTLSMDNALTNVRVRVYFVLKVRNAKEGNVRL